MDENLPAIPMQDLPDAPEAWRESQATAMNWLDDLQIRLVHIEEEYSRLRQLSKREAREVVRMAHLNLDMRSPVAEYRAIIKDLQSRFVDYSHF